MTNTPEVKPGTRCECIDHEVYADWYKGPRKPFHACATDAVRVVTVRVGWEFNPETGEHGSFYSTLMCEPCARFHEERDGERANAGGAK